MNANAMASCFLLLFAAVALPLIVAGAMPRERDALLSFKEGIISDPAGRLASWRRGLDCCQWRGVRCSNLTGHVAKLSLGNVCTENSHGDEFRATALAGKIDPSLLSLEHLEHLDLSCNNLTGPSNRIPEFLGSLKNLRYLDLSYTTVSGTVPPQLGNLSKLQCLDLSLNHLTGHVPSEISMLTNLNYLDLSYNDLDGLITEEHFDGLKSLEYVDLSRNLLKIVVGSEWLPPFKLQEAYFASCQMGPLFPTWLKSQVDILNLNISNTGIIDRLPDWFSDALSKVIRLDMSNNQISGELPTNMETMSLEYLYASSNLLTGQIPPLPRNLTLLRISRNSLSRSLPSSFGAPMLSTLSLYSNYISGRVPDSICELNLYVLDLGCNLFEGELPQCIRMKDMGYPFLCNNSFSGKFPPNLQEATSLSFLDLALNRFSGTLPTWIGNLVELMFLRLNNNMFYGHIPKNITSLVKLHHLNLADNRISGPIPPHLSNLKAMTKKYILESTNTVPAGFPKIVSEMPMVIKRRELRYYGGVILEIVSIDLSSNNLAGVISDDKTALEGLINLNLSWNQLNGEVPDKIGDMQQLESLDLSKNKLTGEIPSSLSNLTSLSILDLSYNCLTGRIPSGCQLDTIYMENPSIYDGNSGLCGPPLQRKCPYNNVSCNGNHNTNGHEFEPMFFYFGLEIGFVVGLWVVFCALLFKKAWRIAYFCLTDNICVFVTDTWYQLARKATTN